MKISYGVGSMAVFWYAWLYFISIGGVHHEKDNKNWID